MRRGCLVILPQVTASFMEQRLEQPSSHYYCYSQGDGSALIEKAASGVKCMFHG